MYFELSFDVMPNMSASVNLPSPSTSDTAASAIAMYLSIVHSPAYTSSYGFSISLSRTMSLLNTITYGHGIM